MTNPINWLPVLKNLLGLTLGIAFGFDGLSFSNVAFAGQLRDLPDSTATHQVPVPGLGKNPWLIESFFKDLGVSNGRDAAFREQLDFLKKILEDKNIPINQTQREMLENLVKNPSNLSSFEELKDLAKGMISKADPVQQKFIREKLSHLEKESGEKGLFSDSDKKRNGGNFSSFNGSSSVGSGEKMPKPIGSNGSNSVKTPPPPFPVDSNPSTGGGRNTPLETKQGKSAVNSVVGTGENANIGDVSRVLTRILPFGLDQQVAPLGKEFLKVIAGWSANIKFPESWKTEIQKVFKEINFQTGSSFSIPAMPAAPSIGGGVSGSRFVLVFAIGAVVLTIGFLIVSKWDPGQISNRSGIPKPIYLEKVTRFVEAMESAIIRLGGNSQVFANHLKWKEDCGAILVARGMGEEFVSHLFEVYEMAKYRGLPPGENEESRLLEALSRYA